MINDTVISFDIIAISLSDLRNYFDSPTKLFSDLYLVKFLNTSTKHFFCVAFLFLFFFSYQAYITKLVIVQCTIKIF